MMKRLQLLLTLTLFIGVGTVFGQVTYNGNGNTGFGDPVGSSSLEFNDDGTTITGTFTKGSGDFNNHMVIYISTGSEGRSAIDGDVDDQGDDNRRAISSAGGDASVISFPSGFEATHGIAISTAFGGIWSIPSSGPVGNNQLGYVDVVGNPSSNTATSFTFSFDWSDIGLSGGDSFSFIITYLNGSNGFLSNEGFGQGLSGSNPGNSDVQFESYFSYPSGNEGGLKITSTSTGNWSSTATWDSGYVPLEGDTVVIAHDVTLDTDATISKLTINSGQTFTSSDASARTLTIVNSSETAQETFVNNGVWVNGSGASTVLLTGSPFISDSRHEITGTSSTAFNNVTVNKENGSDNVGADFQSNTSVNGTLRIGAGGYIATAPPTNFYGNSAILDFNQGSGANYDVNSGDNSWSTTEVPNNITITSGTVTLNEARTLTGELLIESGATLVTNGNFNLANGGVLSNNGTVTGDINFLNELTGTEGFRLLSSPAVDSYSDFLSAIWTQGATTGADTDSGDPNVFTWNTTSDSWTGLTDLSGNITAGTGFLVNVFADDDYDGADDSWPKTLSVTGTENAVDASPSLNSDASGFTLVGNPFATTIDFDNVSTTDLTNVIYIWDPNDESGDGGKNGETVSGSWKTYTKGGSGDVTDGLITAFQGFFVENAASGTPDITFGSASKSTGGSFYGKTTNENRSVVRLELGNSTLKNSMWLSFSEEGSASERVMGDALELEPLSDDYAQLATKKAGILFDIAHLPVQETEYTLPLSIEATKAGSYTLTATKLELSDEITLTFHDYELGVEEVITEEFSYQIDVAAAKNASAPVMDRIQKGEFTLQATSSTSSDRYAISVKPNETTSNESTIAVPSEVKLAQNYPNPFNPSTTISFTLPEAMNVTVKVFDVLGREVSTLAANKAFSAGTTNLTWDASGLNSGMYIYRLEANGVTMTRTMTLIK